MVTDSLMVYCVRHMDMTVWPVVDQAVLASGSRIWAVTGYMVVSRVSQVTSQASTQ